MGESRQELLAWLNNLLQLNITKIEQCGTGYDESATPSPRCVDVPMSRVKFNVNSEYAYLQNFKVLQNVFTKHAVEKPIPVQSLSKCRMQDNLEFLQWTKRYWDQHYPGGEYDAVGRRKASGAPAGAPAARTVSAGSRRGVTPTTGGAARPRVAAAPTSAATAALQQEISTQKEAIAGLEKERDFYFAKLRDIELLLQSAIEADPELEKEEDTLVKHIQGILYSTEDGFEIPAEGEEVVGDDLETF
ncbi:hypothetical protein N7523_005941 [Penicillium sp. IBT 18751x]|nr:hypothetical protein N7523_005941 [Penicillium sp. IBT 18751x]